MRPGGPVCLSVVLVALATGGVVALAGGGAAFWLCLPAALLAGALTRTRLGAVLGAATVLGCAAAAGLTAAHAHSLPPLPLVLFVPAASLSVLVVVRERLAHEREAMRRFALSDSLTGIANRRSLLSRIDYEIARHTRTDRSFTLLMLDLDGFKYLNDRFGHAAGDDLLRDVARALKRSIRGQDTVARIGGDEFCVLAPETDLAGGQRLAARIARALSEVTAGVEPLRASTGVALFPEDGVSADSLRDAADERLLSAKRERHRSRPVRRAA